MVGSQTLSHALIKSVQARKVFTFRHGLHLPSYFRHIQCTRQVELRQDSLSLRLAVCQWIVIIQPFQPAFVYFYCLTNKLFHAVVAIYFIDVYNVEWNWTVTGLLGYLQEVVAFMSAQMEAVR